MRVRVKSIYVYHPTMIDTLYPPINSSLVKADDKVRVINLPGAPKANVMNHCYIETLAGEFIGLVHINSLYRT